MLGVVSRFFDESHAAGRAVTGFIECAIVGGASAIGADVHLGRGRRGGGVERGGDSGDETSDAEESKERFHSGESSEKKRCPK